MTIDELHEIAIVYGIHRAQQALDDYVRTLGCPETADPLQIEMGLIHQAYLKAAIDARVAADAAVEAIPDAVVAADLPLPS